MKKTIFITALGLFSGLSAMNREIIKLPPADSLKAQCEAIDKDNETMGNTTINLTHFLNTTQLHQTLGGQEKQAISIARSVDTALSDYAPSKAVHSSTVQQQKVAVLKAILRDYPEEIESLQLGDNRTRRSKP